MYKYEFVTIRYSMNDWGPVYGGGYGDDTYKKIIKKWADAGYRFVGTIPKKQRSTGHIEELDLVFEKEVKTES